MINNLSKTKKLGEILIDAKLLNPMQLETALIEAKKRNLRLGAALTNLGILSEDNLIDTLSSQLNVKKIDLSKIIIDPAVGKIIPEGLSRQFKMVGISLSDGIFTVALSDPLNVFATDALRRHTNYNIEIVLAKEHEIIRAIDFVYTAKDISKASFGQNITTNTPGAAEGFYNPRAASATVKEVLESEDINIIKLVDNIIFSASKNRASDIHIEPLTDEIIVRERVDGELIEANRIPLQFLNPVIARIKIMANMDIAEKRNPQDSRFEINAGGKNFDVRASIVPMINGEKAVLRLLDKSLSIPKVSDLPLNKNIKDKILKIIYKKYGLFLITGPTGSGKTTTAYSVITELNSLNKNIVTVEDPVEYKIRYANQIEANLRGGVSFTGALRAILRQDPDIILVGEIRDEETARISIQAALTGHFVVSTLHTQDASNAISRLLDMRIEPFLISSSLAGAVGQRLVKKLCDKCKKPYTPEPAVIKELGLPSDAAYTFYREAGCDLCRETGFYGRISIMELLMPTRNIQKLIIERADSAQIRSEAVGEGFIPLRAAGLKRVIDGSTTLEEVLQATQDV
ncbi:MAG: GspE/PulE family protein [Deltaproteobacteria bacterium]|nr:GspE/PulE family protein [Deltaproteobacteria bacterium]